MALISQFTGYLPPQSAKPAGDGFDLLRPCLRHQPAGAGTSKHSSLMSTG